MLCLTMNSSIALLISSSFISSAQLCLLRNVRAGKNGSVGNVPASKDNDLSSDPQNPRKKTTVVMSTGVEVVGMSGFLKLTGQRLSKTDELWAQ